MSSIQILLKKINDREWQMFAPKGHTIGPKFRGDQYNALQWANNFVSTWSNWTIVLDKEHKDEKTN